jgi:predicted transcriptional regulator
MLERVTGLLARMGIKDKDAAVYLTCLHFRQGLYVHEIVKETGLVRSTIDVILERLEGRGLINRVKIEARFKYLAQRPEVLLLRQEELLRDFKEALPALSRLGARTGETEIRFFEGKQGFRDIHDDIILKLKFAQGEGRQLLAFTSGLDVLRIFPDLADRFIRRRVALGIPYRCIAPTSSGRAHEFQSVPELMREVKTVAEDRFPFKVTLEVYADSVMLFSPRRPYGGAVIRNPQIADSVRALFFLVWGLLPQNA